MGNQTRRVRRKIQSGMGDKNHLLAQKPQRESATEDFKSRWKLMGKLKHSEKVYNAIDAKYSYHYEGQRIDMSNESPYYVDVNAHPKRCFPYSVEQHKKLPIERLWETKADFQATVVKRTLEYALRYEAEEEVEGPVNYRVFWSAGGQGQPLKLFQSTSETMIAKAGSSSQSYRFTDNHGGRLYDTQNQDYFTGSIAEPSAFPDSTGDFEIELEFRPLPSGSTSVPASLAHYSSSGKIDYYPNNILNREIDGGVGGRDDDAIGFIVKAKRHSYTNLDGYLILWESHTRVPTGRRLRNLDGFDLGSDSILSTTSGFPSIDTHIHKWAVNDTKVGSGYSDYEYGPGGILKDTANNRNRLKDFSENKGWKKNHLHVYKIVNNKLQSLSAYNGDSISRTGWNLNKWHRAKIKSTGTQVSITLEALEGGGGSSTLTIDTGTSTGTIGLCNLSQAVEYRNMKMPQDGVLSGYVPETGYDTHTGPSKVIATNAMEYIKKSVDRAAKEANMSDIKVTSITGETDGSGGNITVSGLNGKITVEGGSASAPVSGRIPAEGWFEWDGFKGEDFVKEKIHAKDVRGFIVEYISNSLGRDTGAITVTSFNGEVNDPAAGHVTTDFDFVAISSNPPDAGKTYYETHYACGVQTVTPDSYDRNTCVTAFNDIAALFAAEDNAFFNSRDDWDPESFVREYSLTKPVPPLGIDPNNGREILETNENSACVIYGPELPPTETPTCTIDFHFDGTSLCMWSCEFPIEIDIKEFENCVFAYEGMRQFFPLEEFDPNKWTFYKIFPLESAIKTDLDYFGASDDQDLMNVAIGSYVEIKTDDYYEIRFPEEIPNIGEVTTENTVEIVLPSFPEHFVDPIYHKPAIEEGSREIRFLLDVWENKEDVAIRWITDKTPLNGMYDVNPSEPTWDGILEYSKWHTNILDMPKAVIGEAGMKLMYVSERRADQVQGRHFIQIQCLERATITGWNSGMIIGHVSVNGGYPLLGSYKGKRDVRGIQLDNLFFPKDLIPESLIGPIVSVQPEYVNWKVESDKTLTLSSDHMTDHEWYTDWVSEWNYDSKEHSLTYGNFETEAKHVFDIESFVNNPKIDVKKLEISDLIVESNNPFVELSVGQLSDVDKMLIKMKMNGVENVKIPVNGYFKKTYPYSWSPMVHSGYYYMEEQEKYLYADRQVDTITAHEQKLSSRPRQGAPILAQNKDGEMLSKTMGFDNETLSQSHINSESFVGSGHSKYTLNKKGILKNSLVIYINDRLLDKEEFLFTEVDNSIRFMYKLKESDHVYVEYSIEKSFYVDMFEGLFNASSEVGLNFDLSNNSDVLYGGKVFYEGSTHTPFYYASEVQLNPLRQNIHSGFLYIDEEVERKPDSLKVKASHTYIDVNSSEKVTLIAEVLDEYGNPLENIDVEFYENGNKLATSRTNLSGEATLTIIPDINIEFVTRIGVKVNDLHHAIQLNNTKPFVSKRKYIEMKADRYEFIAGKPSGIIKITATLRDENWLKVKSEKIKVTIVNTKGITQESTIVTMSNGEASISINAANESKGEILIKMEHGQNDELAMNFLYIRVTGE